jgi:Tat protein secretion system quality control protein TatD with DNase activity
MLLLLLSWSRHLVHLASSLGKSVFLYCFDGSLDIFACLEVFHWFFILTCFSYSAVLADIMLKEKLHIFGILGCALCVVGSTTIVLHAPQERAIESVAEVWDLATEPGALLT